MRNSLFLPVALLLCLGAVTSVKVINNGLAPPEIVHTPISSKPRCTVKAAPLDLVFILDSSGSLRNQFQDEIDVIRRIVKHVTIGPTATRVMLVQFSGVQHLEFDFNKFHDREEVLSALGVLRHVSGITRVGGAFEFTMSKMTLENGMRDSSVPKIVYLLSDGRTHDYPKDAEMSDLMRRQIRNLDIWAYGTGEYVAMPELLNITKDAKKIITNKNLNELEPLFDSWKGIEVCEVQPSCIKGSDKPLDLFLVIDSSESIDKVFHEQIIFSIERIIQNINIHPDAVRLALITFSGQPFLHFKFNDPKQNNNTAVIRYLNTLRSIKGTTSTHLALQTVADVLRDPTSQSRPNVPKLAIVITDGRSARPPYAIAQQLKSEGVHIIAVAMSYPPQVDEHELQLIADSPDFAFTPKNVQEFEGAFLKFVGFGCPGLVLGPNATPRVRGATDVTCGPNSVTFTVRTQKPMNGLMYAQQFNDDPKCVHVANGVSRELTLTFVEGTCGLSKTPSADLNGFNYNITVILQFHPLVITRADQGLDVSCFHQQPISLQDIGRVSQKRLTDTQCSYRLHRFGPQECAALDAKVGESLWHRWECDSPPNYQYLVHDCFVRSDRKSAQILDSEGCEIDPHFLETPDYSRFQKPRRGDAYVFQEMSVFKFPGDDNVVFQCKISLCDMEGNDACRQMIPPRCAARVPTSDDESGGPKRLKRGLSATKAGFAMTFDLETRTLNVLENEAIRPPTPIRYCDLRF
uniref:VWFA domain-containing protein n=1 Tax=Panagrellus redivivus TaxID=6233 RepID=A0A7E4ZWU6_PANRE